MTAISRAAMQTAIKNHHIGVRITAGAHTSLDESLQHRVVHLSGQNVWVVNPLTDYVCKISIEHIKHAFLMGDKDPMPADSGIPAADRQCILWCPTSTLPPKVVQANRTKAEGVAQDMAKRHPGEEFFVCELVAKAHTPKPTSILIAL